MYNPENGNYHSESFIRSIIPNRSFVRLWDVVIGDKDDKDDEDDCADQKYYVWCRHPETGHFTYSNYFVENIIERSTVTLKHSQHRAELITHLTFESNIVKTYCTINGSYFYIYFSRTDENEEEDIGYIGLTQPELDSLRKRIVLQFNKDEADYNFARLGGECYDCVPLPNILWCYNC
jgi:hypothetical protein